MNLNQETISAAAQRMGIAAEDLTAVVQQGSVTAYEAGAYLFHESTPRLWLGIVLEGDVEVQRGAQARSVILTHGDQSARDIVEALKKRRVAIIHDNSNYGTTLADQVQRMRAQVDQASPLAALTQTQFAVLRLVTQGYTTPRIAEMRGTTTSAVEKVLGSIYDALEIPRDDGISRRSEAMRIFVEYAGLPPRD